MKALLVWQMVPEEIAWYIIENPDDEEVAALTAAHGSFINTINLSDEMERALDRINAALAKQDEGKGFTDDATQWLGRWHEKSIPEESLPNIGPIDKVFTCGFLL